MKFQIHFKIDFLEEGQKINILTDHIVEAMI